MATRGAIVRHALWRGRSAYDVHARPDRYREARRHGRCRAAHAQGFVCRTPDAHALGPSASRVLQRRSVMDLPRDALCLCARWIPRRGDYALARGEGDMANAAGLFSRLDRDTLPNSGFLLRREIRAPPPRLQRQYRWWLPRRATDAGIYRGEWHAPAEQASCLYARPRSAPDPGHADGIDRYQRRRFLLSCSWTTSGEPRITSIRSDWTS